MIDDTHYNVSTQDIEEALFIVNNLYCYDNIEYIDILDEYENDKKSTK